MSDQTENPWPDLDQPLAAKYCPFCGSERMILVSRHVDGVDFEAWVECKACEARGPGTLEEEKARYAWNCRFIRDPRAAGIAVRDRSELRI